MIYQGAKFKCKKQFSIDKTDFSVGDECKIVGFQNSYVNFEAKNLYWNQLRHDFTYFWNYIYDDNMENNIPFIKNDVKMIVDRHPDQPGEKTKLKYIGYWAIHPNIFLDEYAQKGILLPWPENFIDDSWNQEEMNKVADYLDGCKILQSWRGYDNCRICRGTIQTPHDLTDGKFVFPGGFVHYVFKHKVKPPEEFIDHILKSI